MQVMQHKYCYPTVRPLPATPADQPLESEFAGPQVIAVSERPDRPATLASTAAAPAPRVETSDR
jgi:hypothetical protein